ncbi:transient receptor potential cation channel protein painless isoform X2 [Copidosoma floridanum]|uniref:transient receptor potential cation channel protein painless isoform X2 n=1 Tax=Copidosoma floridanum TaxID=29053 RepID=UPI0006C9A562|nr:transient receptor potential cation channel protein painless isoform X2 [Copidosoma floridanum]
MDALNQSKKKRLKMIWYEDSVEMQFLQPPSTEVYVELLQLMLKGHYEAFKSFILRAMSKEPAWVNLNYQIPYPTSMSFLDVASSNNLANFVEFLLDLGADPNLVNGDQKRAPLHFAAEQGCEEALVCLLRMPCINPNLEVAGLTALHFAVKGDHRECARYLLNASASPNLPNNQGVTALHLAADKGTREMVELIVKHSEFLILDVFRDRKEETARSLIVQKYPDIALPDVSAIPSTESLLRYYLLANDEVNFAKVLGKVDNIETIASNVELLRLAVEKNLHDTVMRLLDRNPLEQDTLIELGRMAVRCGYSEIILALIKKSPRLADKLLLPVCQELGVPTGRTDPSFPNTDKRLECFKIVMAQEGVNVRQEDDKGNSCLHYASRAECQEATEMLLRRGSYIGHVNNFGVPPLAHMSADILESRLSECVTCSDDRSEEYEVNLDYKNLVPHGVQLPGEDELSRYTENPLVYCNEMDPLLYIAEHRHLRRLLKHPLLASFLYLKFLRIRYLLYANLLIYALFYVVLNTYIWLLTTDSLITKEPSGNVTKEVRDALNISSKLNSTSFIENLQRHPLLVSLSSFGFLYLVVRESLQLISSPVYYILSLENWLELGLIGSTLGFLYNNGPEVGALTIFLSTWEFMILLSHHPRMSTDIEMFKTVTINFTKFLFLYVFLILAFALSFYVLFQDKESFPNPFRSLFKTIVMLTGEFDSSSLPFSAHPVLSRLIFVGFIFLVVIILLNLLNGLAVNDTAEILAEAELVGLVARVRLLAYVERIAVGSNTYSSSTLLCCFNYLQGQLSLKRLRQTPLSFIARRLLLFPRFLPQTRLSVKPLKNFEMTLHGRTKSSKHSSKFFMDRSISWQAKKIAEARGKDTDLEKVLLQIRNRFDRLEIALRDIKAFVQKPNNES